MRPIFCGNFDYDARHSELERLFRRYGRVERVDMKSGFAFIYMEDERDAEDAIRGLDRVEFGRKGRRLRVEWSNQERGIRRPGGGGSSRRSANTRPSKTLFVINFDPQHTRMKDLERHFDPYGKIVNVRIRRNFAFVQYELQEDATEALEATNMSKLLDRVISVEYAVRDDDEKRDGYSPGRTCDRSPDGRSYGRRRSPSPSRRDRGSPDYGRGPSPGPYRRDRASTDYGRHRSPSPYRRDRTSPDYGRASSHSPTRRERAGSDYGRVSGPYQRDRMSPDGGRDRSPYQGEKLSPYRRERAGSDYHRVSSPYQRERTSPDGGRDHSPYPANGHGPNCSPLGNERADFVNGRDTSRNPYDRNEVSPDNDCRVSPNSMPDEREIPNDAGAESPVDGRDNSRSPLAADD